MMKTLKFNGENWYTDERSRWKRIRQWIILISGWELANGKGWRFRFDLYQPGDKKMWMHPTPISLFGHRITFFGWGWQIRAWHRFLVWSRENGLYVSSDGTPPSDYKAYPHKGFYLIRRHYRPRLDPNRDCDFED